MQKKSIQLLVFAICTLLVESSSADCIILLHGLARTASSMNIMEEAFQRRGFRVANVNYPSRKAPVEKLAHMAVRSGLETCANSPDERIHFVTHSMGGILVRYYLARNEIQNLGRVVMLAPPNKGSEVVDSLAGVPGFKFINGPAGLQLGTDHQSIPSQLGAVDYPVGVIAGTRSINPILSQFLPNPDDGKVSLQSTRVEGMSDFIALPLTHPFIMRSQAAVRQAISFVETGAFARGAL